MTDIKSQDELTQDGRSNEVIISVLDMLMEAKDDCRILARKLKEKAPELEDWLNTNFGEYL
jgi:hypothetical protein